MIIFPAIDIKDGKVIRLFQGHFDQVTEYGDDPVAVAQRWAEEGAQYLHVVDLDGARSGSMKNADVIKAIAKSVSIPIEVGGGIRTRQTVDELVEAGVARVILGTRAVDNQDLLKDLLTSYRDKIAVSLDCHNGFVASRGWVATTSIKAADLAEQLQALGVACLIYTDISRDGTLQGPNMIQLESLLHHVSVPVIASGGVSNLEDIKKLKTLEPKGLIGVITGKAIYEGTLNLKDALALC